MYIDLQNHSFTIFFVNMYQQRKTLYREAAITIYLSTFSVIREAVSSTIINMESERDDVVVESTRLAGVNRLKPVRSTSLLYNTNKEGKYFSLILFLTA